LFCCFVEIAPPISVKIVGEPHSVSSGNIVEESFFDKYFSEKLLYYSYLFCCFVEIKKYPCGAFFLIVYLHLQWKAVLTQIMLCLAETVLRDNLKEDFTRFVYLSSRDSIGVHAKKSTIS
jgi:hypothetical protein